MSFFVPRSRRKGLGCHWKCKISLLLLLLLLLLLPSIAFLTALQEANEHKCYLKYDIKIQWLITHHAMRTICLLNLLPFLHSAPEPDTHLHVYLPKESEQGNYVLVASFSTVSSKGENLLEGL